MATNLLYHYDNSQPDAEIIESEIEGAVTTLAQMQTINTEGGLRMWIVPQYNNRRHFAWNPITFKAVQLVFNIGDYATIPSGAVQYDVTIAGTAYKAWAIKTLPTEIVLQLFDNAGTLKCALKADTMQGEAVFNVAPIVRNWFGERVADPEDNNGTYVMSVKDTAQFTTFKVNVDSGYMREYFVQNAISQAGEDGDKSFGGDILLTEQRHFISWVHNARESTLHWYPRMYPVVSILVKNAKTITYEGVSVSLDAKSVYRFYINSQQNVNALNTAFGLELTWEQKEYYDISDKTGCNPYPIRWLNRKGGYEQYLFLHREFKTKESKTTGLREVYTDNTGTQISNRKPYAVEGSRSIKVGAERISAQELDILTKMPYSPQIEWYDTAQDDGMGVWSGVSVSKFSHTEQTDATCHDFEIELECPAINMQFE